MKSLVGLFVLMMSLKALAGDSAPTLQYQVKPVYPKELQRIGLPGEVRTRFKVNPDGSVADLEILYSTHPEFAGAALKAMSEWRFSAWKQEEGGPKHMVFFSPLVFTVSDTREALGNMRHFDLKGATCRTLNNEVSRFNWRNLNVLSGGLTLFMVTRNRLIDLDIAKKLSTEQLSETLFDLAHGMAQTIKTCQAKPGSLFLDALAESVKARLVVTGHKDQLQLADKPL